MSSTSATLTTVAESSDIHTRIRTSYLYDIESQTLNSSFSNASIGLLRTRRRDSDGSSSSNSNDDTFINSTTSPEGDRLVFPTLSNTNSNGQSSTDDDIKRIRDISKYMQLKRIVSVVDAVGYGVRYFLPLPMWSGYFEYGPAAKLLSISYIVLKLFLSSSSMKTILTHLTYFIKGKLVSNVYKHTYLCCC